MFSLFKIFDCGKEIEGKLIKPAYGKLYKIKGESLPFRYIKRKGDVEKGIHCFKHHNLKQYIFYNFQDIEREASRKEIKIYNIIKSHVNAIAKSI